MKASLKIVFLSLLFLTSAIYLKAQEKYDYAIVKFVSPAYAGHTGLFVSISGKQFEQVEIKKEEVGKETNDCTPLLNYVQKMTGDGWRVINTFNEGTIISFVLERKSQ